MVTLQLLHPQQTTPLQQWEFRDRSVIRIGRAPDNDVILTNPLVSRYHLELRRLDSAAENSWHLINQGTNGTFLDGKLISQSLLKNGSLVQLARGGPLLKFQLEAEETGQEGAAPRHESGKASSTDKKANEKSNLSPSKESLAPPSLPSPLPNSPTPQACTHSGNSPGNLFCIHCGQPLSVQQRIRQYQVLRILGQGGMGTTYLAWNPTSTNATGASSSKPQLLVLKEMNADLAKVAKAQELFEREAHTLKTLHHPGIPQYYDFFMEAGKKYLAMELIHGQNLEQLVYQTGPVTPARAIAWMLQTCDVLEYIHSQDPPLIHRDIKPANLILRTVDNRIVVLDFGAVKATGTAYVTRIGAEGYCAPEQERGQPLIQSDLYAIGPTLIFLLTGEAPLKFYRLRGKGYRFDLDAVPTITPELRKVIERVTEHHPSDRYVTAKELAAALSACK
ncbi:MAG TPA: serine/threonine protein kinase [Cyanobacteria bacterium UBA11049]|nr:serine/threonine protein kinase [Cyanobacteria bacterium UBA11049]